MIRVPGSHPIFIDADPVGGWVIIDLSPGVRIGISAVQSEALRRVLERAEQVVETGVGDMEER